MQLRAIPGRRAIGVLAAVAAALLLTLLARVPLTVVSRAAMAASSALLAVAGWDYVSSWRAWRRSSATMTRRLPAAFAIAVKRPVQLTIDTNGADTWRCALHDHADATLLTDGQPVSLTLAAGTRTEVTYTVNPTTRGEVSFAPADIHIRSRWGLWELLDRIGAAEMRRVYPDFAQVARYAWLAGDRRLQEIGIKTYQLRGGGTDFKELSEYRAGEPVRHIDWRATLRAGKPIVRQFQDERDQCVMLLVDCGRRMRADDRGGAAGTTHFDQVLNAVMLLTFVALKQGDAVGAMTFGTAAGEARHFAPRKGVQTLNALIGQLYDVQPTATHSDYLDVAQELLRKQHKRALIIVITNFRDEDSTEMRHALRLLRQRHLVMLASLRERIVGDLLAQPLTTGEAAIDVASAHVYEQSRRDAFNRLATRDALMVDAEPEHLGIELVNRYHAVKRAGLI